MNREQYENRRRELLNEAQTALNDGNMELFNQRTADVEALDQTFEESCRAQANLRALEGVTIGMDLANQREVTVIDGAVVETMGNQRNENPYASTEYQNAFMNFVCRGTPIPGKFQNMTTTTDTAAVIPTTILKEIITELKTYGNIYNKVRKLNIQGGVAVPILSLKPEAKWIGETTPSTDQKIEAKEKITFTYHGLECKISQSLLVNVVTLDMFQQMFVPLAAEAIVIAMEKAIVSGDGTGQPLGITKDSRIPSANIITVSETDIASWKDWKKNVFAKMKKSYRSGEFVMEQSTFDIYIDGMEDKNGQPIGRVNYGIDGAETYRFGGKNVETVEDDILPSFEACQSGEVFAIFVKWSDYAINSNMEMQTVKWTDHDTNEVKNKCILIADGKLIDPNGVLILKKA